MQADGKKGRSRRLVVIGCVSVLLGFFATQVEFKEYRAPEVVCGFDAEDATDPGTIEYMTEIVSELSWTKRTLWSGDYFWLAKFEFFMENSDELKKLRIKKHLLSRWGKKINVSNPKALAVGDKLRLNFSFVVKGENHIADFCFEKSDPARFVFLIEDEEHVQKSLDIRILNAHGRGSGTGN